MPLWGGCAEPPDPGQGRRLFGPITFGEIAYLLLNQTLVYLEIHWGVFAKANGHNDWVVLITASA